MKTDKIINEKLLRSMGIPNGMDRRGFLKRIGGGLVVAFSVSSNPLKAAAILPDEEPGINAYLHVGEDGRVKLFTGKIEMGQGPITSLPMQLADELDVKLEDVDIVMGDTELCPWDQGTYGSLSTRVFGQKLRQAAAKARALLLNMAAEELSTTLESLEVQDGIVKAKDSGKSITYAELTKGKEILETNIGDVKMKDPSQWKIQGTSRHHVDAVDKVTGKAKYSGDMILPGMKRARILRPPSLGAKLVSVDTSAAEEMEGVKVVRDGDLVAVLHSNWERADQALARVKAEWEEEHHDLDKDSIFDFIMEVATKTRKLASHGDLKKGESLASQSFDIEYRDPYLAHSPMENHTATAVMEDGKLKVWASCQTPYPTQKNIAELLNMKLEDVRLMPIFLGGGFGGKCYNPQAEEAAQLAKLTGVPIQLIYSREEEFMYDRLRPAAVVKIRSGVDKQGSITHWDYSVHQGGGREAEHFYDIPNSRTREFFAPWSTMRHPFFTGAWRAPSVNTNSFARESQMDIMAAEIGVDPVEFRLRHLENNPRMHRVVEKVSERFGYTPAKGPSGRGIGMAAGIDVNTFVAVMVEVEVDENTGDVQVKRSVCAQDMGLVINPQGAIIQAEGCMLMGLGYALREEILFESRKMLSRNYDNYFITQFNMVPELDVVIMDSEETVPHGAGEPAIVVMGGAIANAVFDAVGIRPNRLPLNPERVLQTLNER